MQFSEEERKAKRTAQKLKWAHENPAKVVGSRRKFNENHPGYYHKYSETETARETSARWRDANREKINANQRDRAKKYPEYCRGKALDYQANTQVSHRPCNIRKGARLAEV